MADRVPSAGPLAHLAARPEASQGREFEQPGDGTRGPRSAFQRDRDRIIHSIAFRRLRSKTQVFVAPDGDHYRTRLTHSLEVAQIARVIARALGLDEDLTEALSLAHDIGHPPFGHAGEDALDLAIAAHGGFDHNAQTLRTLMRIESPYPTHDGLNLSWEVLEGLAKHNGPVDAPHWSLAELDRAFPLDLATWPSLEAQVAAVADDIAYDNHDIDDGLRAGFIELDDLLTLDFVRDQWREVERRFPSAPRDRQLRELVRGQIGWMVNDVIEQAREAAAGLGSRDEIARAGQVAGFSPAMRAAERRLKAFMYARLYHHPQQVETADKARVVIGHLFEAYSATPALLGPGWAEKLPADEPQRSRHIADYIAGMTDRFALDRCRELDVAIPDDLSNV
ncbi:deoxyguanosinetriphosphate triphosphohydrolase [Erythrobacter sp. LQ02-29]|uniref:deoxyguanosinetriphosphate triphosphohydrolase n=1 Tax=Erythrobacter sp. LQ02-29 TaxID=2920384 RepID=UPI001F4EB5CF|nr:deoxyguanosinetriphosphate triphosphohydrolase [Erythrobacter sp. LQ02-29]MCP9222337.1 deoxyguanosinetriphosphate triphosphohydrolase [Erythrobacter sp. LQ02-29]